MNNLKISRFAPAQNSLCHYWKSFVILLNCFSLLSKIKNFVNKHREQCASAAKEQQLTLFQGLQSAVYSHFKVISLIAWIF